MARGSKATIGLDIGTHSIKLVQLEMKGKRYHLTHFAIMPLQNEAIVDGSIMMSDVIVEAIRNLAESEVVKTKDVALAVSGTSVIVKRITLPQMEETDLAESILWEAEQYIPFEIDEVNVDFEILGTSNPDAADEEESLMDVLLVAAKKEKIEDYTGVVIQAGLNPTVVDVDAFAIENAYLLGAEDYENRVLALINVGAEVTNINILRNGTSAFVRDIPIGGVRYTEAIQKELSVSYSQAESLKMGVPTEGFSPMKLVPIVTSVTEDIAREIQTSLDFYRTSAVREEIDRIVLSGGCVKTKGFDQFLSENLGIETVIADPFKNINYNEKEFDPEYLKEMAPLAAVGVGLAIRHMEDKWEGK